jgi:hypothetical protein
MREEQACRARAASALRARRAGRQDVRHWGATVCPTDWK